VFDEKIKNISILDKVQKKFMNKIEISNQLLIPIEDDLNHISIYYDDYYRTKLYGLGFLYKKVKKINNYSNFYSYLADKISDYNDYIVGNKLTGKKISFWKIQKNKSFLKMKTFYGNTLRVAGLTEDIFLEIINEILEFSKSEQINILDIIFYGSRVMPRKVAWDFSPNSLANMPIQDDGVVKDKVRVSGPTSISDMQIRVLFDSGIKEDESYYREISKKLNYRLIERIALFPISTKFVKSLQGTNLLDHYFSTLIPMFEKGRFSSPKMQYASVMEMPFILNASQNKGNYLLKNKVVGQIRNIEKKNKTKDSVMVEVYRKELFIKELKSRINLL